jgi:hypothetical protein
MRRIHTLNVTGIRVALDNIVYASRNDNIIGILSVKIISL